MSASEDGDVLLWDVRTKKILQRLKGHKGVCFWADTCEDLVVSGGQDGLVRVYQHKSRQKRSEDEAPVEVIQDKTMADLPIRQEDLKTEIA